MVFWNMSGQIHVRNATPMCFDSDVGALWFLSQCQNTCRMGHVLLTFSEVQAGGLSSEKGLSTLRMPISSQEA